MKQEGEVCLVLALNYLISQLTEFRRKSIVKMTPINIELKLDDDDEEEGEEDDASSEEKMYLSLIKIAKTEEERESLREEMLERMDELREEALERIAKQASALTAKRFGLSGDLPEEELARLIYEKYRKMIQLLVRAYQERELKIPDLKATYDKAKKNDNLAMLEILHQYDPSLRANEFQWPGFGGNGEEEDDFDRFNKEYEKELYREQKFERW